MNSNLAKPAMGMFWLLFTLMLFLHQDFWNWSTETMAFLGMPTGLFYHVIFSIACSFLGAWAVNRAWPEKWEKYADEEDDSKNSRDQYSDQ